MPVTALLKITQGSTVIGEAFEGTIAGGVVTLENDDNTDVVAWEFSLLSADYRTALATGVLGTLSSATFTPDVTGSYRCKIKVTAADGSFDEDTRVFSVVHPGQGYVTPAFQQDALAAEHNFGAQLRGWAGSGSPGPKLLDDMVRELSAYIGLSPLTPAQLTASVNNYGPAGFSEAALVRLDSNASWNVTGLDATAAIKRKLLVNVGAFPVVLTHQDAGSTDVNRIIVPGGASHSLAAVDDIVPVIYDSVSLRWRVVVP